MLETILFITVVNFKPVELCRFVHNPKDENLTILVKDVAKALDIQTVFQVVKLCEK